MRKTAKIRGKKFLSVAAQLKKTKAWSLFSDFIRKRDKYTCITCGKKKKNGVKIDAGHFISATGHINTLFDEQNVFAQCAGCNIQGDVTKPRYTLVLIERFGIEYVYELERRSKIYKVGYSREELKKIEDKYQ